MEILSQPSRLRTCHSKNMYRLPHVRLFLMSSSSYAIMGNNGVPRLCFKILGNFTTKERRLENTRWEILPSYLKLCDIPSNHGFKLGSTYTWKDALIRWDPESWIYKRYAMWRHTPLN